MSSLSTGPHEYVIRYRTTRQIGFFADYDELYWNATGTGWTFAIDSAEARITLPEAVPFRQSAFYTGPQGATGKDAAIVEQRPGHIVFRTTRALPPRNGLTVAAAWQKGVVAPPSAGQQTGWWLAGQSRRAWSPARAWRRARLLRLRLAAVRPRSAARHHHSVVRPARGHVGRGGALRGADGLRPALLHRGDRGSRGERPHQAHRRRRADRDRAPRRRQADRSAGTRPGEQAVRRQALAAAHPGQSRAARQGQERLAGAAVANL